MKLTHPFIVRHYDALNELLTDTNSLPIFLKKLRKYAKAMRDPSLADGEPDSNQLKIIGDGFECFGEFFVKYCGQADNRIYVKDFKLLDITDNGVDAMGIDSKTGQLVFIQFKCYRETEYLTGVRSHLDSFVAESEMILRDMYKSPTEMVTWPRHVVITSAADIHPYTKEQKYRGRVECYNHKDLHTLTDNHTFWDTFRELLK